MNGGIKWSDDSTREFIQLRYKLRHLFNGRKHQCEKAYSRIVDELGLRNVISPTQARKKWSNLLQKYMDIKGGYSTANQDWPYFQILDQIVPLMRKEKIEKLPPSSDPKDLEGHDSLDPLTSPPCDPCDPDPMPGVQGVTADVGKCKTEVGDTGEPPRKRGRGRRAALRARDRWWGAVEDSDLGSDSVGSGAARGDLPPHPPTKADPLEASQMELQTFNMLETCSSALTEIRDVLRTHTQRQENFMQSLQQTVSGQSSTMSELLSTVASQNTTLITLLHHLTANKTQASIDINMSDNFTEGKMRSGQGGHREEEEGGELLTPPHHLMTTLTHQPQQCNNPLVQTPGLADAINGL